MGLRTVGLVSVTVLLAVGDASTGEAEVVARLAEIFGPAGGAIAAVGWFWLKVSERFKAGEDAKKVAEANKKDLEKLLERLAADEAGLQAANKRYRQLLEHVRVLREHIDDLKDAGRTLQLALRTDSESTRDELLAQSSAVFAQVTPRFHERS